MLCACPDRFEPVAQLMCCLVEGISTEAAMLDSGDESFTRRAHVYHPTFSPLLTARETRARSMEQTAALVQFSLDEVISVFSVCLSYPILSP